MFKKYNKIHFIGIGGIGMSGIAEVLMTLGYNVRGSDVKKSAMTERLHRRGAKIFIGHKASHIDGADVVVYSSAVKPDNVEYVEAKRKGALIVPRAEMLAELMRLKYGVAVAGTHGKTSTTSMIATAMFFGGLDPTMVIGGKVNSFRTNARLGKSEYLVAEADESDLSFLNLTPTIAVITNIDPEHMENYRDFDHVKECYIQFANKVPFYGVVVACADHPVVREVAKSFKRKCITYGVKNDADFMANDIRQVEDRLQFMVWNNGKKLGAIRLNMVGKHNAVNALAVIAVCTELGVPFEKIAEGLSKFKGIERRFQILRRGAGPMVVSDYCHHPTEIDATINAARDAWPEKRLVFIHQPHRYSRLKALFPDFVKVLNKVDHLALLPIYGAGEKAIRGVGTRQLYVSLKRRFPKLKVDCLKDHDSASVWAKKNFRDDDLVIFSGAGDVHKLAKHIVGEI